MRTTSFNHLGCFLPALGIIGFAGTPEARAQWPQWGGANRDFIVETKGLANSWPEDGPPRIWHRELGDGYSSIVVDSGVLYTMYRIGTDEFTVALQAETGKTIWEHRNPSPNRRNADNDRVSPGPNSTPLVVGTRLYTVGTDSVIHCFEKQRGKVLWTLDLIRELGGRVFPWGYASSPMAYKNLLITPVGRERGPKEGIGADRDGPDGGPSEGRKSAGGPTLVALDLKSGKVVWQSQDYAIRHSSPLLISFQGEDQIVMLLSKGIMAVRPDNGERLWHHKFTDGYYRDMTPLWIDGDRLIVGDGEYTCAIQLTRKNGRTVTEEVWSNPKLRFPQNNPIHVGAYIYGSSGSVYKRATMVCAEAATGKRAWAKRGFALATCVYGDGKLIILDENGQLGLATVGPDGMLVHSTCRVTERESWTVPTLVGTTLYVRDRKHIMALDLG
jgi:outer membrane protein assembly factor BamB